MDFENCLFTDGVCNKKSNLKLKILYVMCMEFQLGVNKVYVNLK
jgi:hypothetical protein